MAMDNNNSREMSSTMIAVSKAAMWMDPFFKLTATGAALMITALARMVKERKIKKGDFKSVTEFLRAADGRYSITNVPVIPAGENAVMDVSGHGGIVTDVDIKKELDRMGIKYVVLPDLDKADGFLQIAVYDGDKEVFDAWMERYLVERMSGGEKTFQDLQNLTNGRTSIISIPAEGREEMIAEDFRTLGINYSFLPDLNVGDGEIQVVVANADVQKVEHWFQLYKGDRMASGEEVEDMRTVSMEQYTKTGEMTEEQYVDTMDEELSKANEKYEGRTPGAVENRVRESEKRVRSMDDATYEKFHANPDYVEISINHETLVEKSHYGQTEREREAGLFTSRVPSTWGKEELTLVVPQEQVFLADGGQTYVAFLKKDENALVMGNGGRPVPIGERMTGQEIHDAYYNEVTRTYGRQEKRQYTLARNQENRTADRAGETRNPNGPKTPEATKSAARPIKPPTLAK